MKTSLHCAVFAAVLSLAGNSFAQEKVKLRLSVLDAETGRPVENYRALAFNSAVVPGLPVDAPDGQWTGNLQGEAAVEFKAGNTNGYHRRLQVHHPDYVPIEKSWWHYPKNPSAQPEAFPEEFTVKLEHGVTIGGVVKDEDGKPLSGVRVYPLRHNYRPGPSSDSWPAWPASYTWDGAANALHAKSDTSGRWQLAHFPRAFADVAFAFVRPDQSFVTLYTGTDEFLRYSGPVISISNLLASQAELSLPRGHTVGGTVVGEDGQPLAGVSLSETHGRMPGIVARTATGADGRFALPNRPAKEIVLVARAAGRAAVATNILVEPGLPEFRLVLRPQQGIAGRVLDGEGKPIVGARVALDQYKRLSPFEWDGTTTDTEGRFRWDEGPFEPAELYVMPTNGPTRKVTLRAGEPVRVIVIRPEQAEFIRLTGTVVDAETKEPVKQFSLASSGSDTYVFNFKADGRDGRLEVKLPLTAWRENHLPEGDLQVLADGFQSQPIGRVEFREGDREYHVLLKRGQSQMAGVVSQPDGKPAEGARMELARGGSFTFLNRPGEFQQAGRESERFTTGADGKYSFAADQRNKSFVVTHASGFAAVWPSNLVGAASIQLQPWARVSGVAMESGKPLPNQNVSLRSPSSAFNVEPCGISYSATTDSEGRFNFERVPAGRYVLSRRLPTPSLRSGPGSIQFSHAQGVTVRAGEDKEVTYGGKGRTVIGMAQGDPPGLAVNWQWDINYLTPAGLTAKPTQPNFYDYASQETYMAALRRFQAGGGGDPVQAEVRYQVQFDSDGRFLVADVPPGKYELAINLTEPQSNRDPFLSFRGGKPIGSARQVVLIPDGPLDQPVDVGTVLVKVTGNLPQAKPLPPFEALTLDGQPLRASDFRGKHVALVFWAGWCRASAEALPELERIYSSFQSNPRFAMVGVSLDESPAVARNHAGRLGLKWATGWLDEPGRLRLMDTYGVNGIPTAFLLDPAGKIAARDLKPASLRAALDKALGSK